MTSVRLDAKTESILTTLAKRRGQTKSDVIRDAIEHLAEETRKPDSAYQRLRAFSGIADSGGRQLSTDTGRRFRQHLEEKRRAGGSD